MMKAYVSSCVSARLAHVGGWLALAAVLAGPPALQAVQFSHGELTGSFDSTFSIGALYRLGDPSPELYGTTNTFNGVAGQQNSVNTDDGNLNFGKGWVSTLFKGSHDLELRYGNFGAFARAYYFSDVKSGDTLRTKLSPDGEAHVVRGIQLLDAYVLAKFDLAGDRPVDLRIGRQVLSLGESTFLPNGINVVNPVDLSKLRNPGAELKEALLPVAMIKASIGLTPNLTVEPFWLLEWRQNELEPAGSYFSTNDIASRGGRKVMLGFGSLPDTGTLGAIARNDDRTPDALNQYGVAVHLLAPALNDTDFGFYYAKFNSRSPVISALTPTTPISAAYVQATASSLAQSNLAPAMIAHGVPSAMIPTVLSGLLGNAFAGTSAAALPPGLQPFAAFYPSAQTIVASAGKLGLLNAAATARYFVEYPEDIDLLGASFNTSVGNTGISWQGEVSYKHGVPLQVDDVELLFSALSTLNPAFKNNQLGDYLGRYGTEISGYRRHDVWSAQTTFTKVFGRLLGAEQFNLVGEVGGIWADLPAKSTLRYDGPGTATAGDATEMALTGNGAYAAEPASAFADDFSWGYQLLGKLDYNNLFAGVNVSPSIGFTHDVSGNTPLPLGNYVRGRKSVTLAAEFVFQNSWVFELRYVNYFGAGRYNLLSDRDFVATTLRYSF